jgi:hypothetical protein
MEIDLLVEMPPESGEGIVAAPDAGLAGMRGRLVSRFDYAAG